MAQRTFTAAFIEEAVRQMEVGKHSATALARALGVSRQNLYLWQAETAPYDSRTMTDQDLAIAEMSARRRERHAIPEEEKEIFLEFQAFFGADGQ